MPPSSGENIKAGLASPSGTIKGDIYVGKKQCYFGPAFDTAELLATHKTNTGPTDKSYRCHFCDEEGEGHKQQGFRACWRHVHTKHLEKVPASVPRMLFGNEDDFQCLAHMVSMHGIGKMLECHICEKKFVQKIPQETPRISSLPP